MTNFAPVLSQIQEALATAAKNGLTWATGALIVTRKDEKGAEIAYILADQVDLVITYEEREALEEAGLLVDGGKLLTVRRGKNERVKVLGVLLTQLKHVVEKAQSENSARVVLNQKVKRLERELRLLSEQKSSDEELAHLIREVRTAVGGKAASIVKPVKFTRTRPTKGQALAGIPTLMLSDWHWGETVDPAQINYMNEYNLDVARSRASRVFSTALELLFHHQAGQSYDGMTVILAGDMFSGNIHEELRQTNGAPILECVMDLAQVLASNIVTIAQNFEWVYVPGVVGNHGRLDRKPTAKNAVKDNFDWMLYHLVASLVQGKLGERNNVDFDISKSLDLRFDLYNTRYLLTHGDQIQGGSGIGGFWPSMMKTAMKKQQREVAAGGEGFDYMVCGHFHKYGSVSNVIVNGSLKGYDEWVYKMNFEHEPAIQALWTTHPDYGIIDNRPVFADVAERDSSSKAQPVTTYRTGLQGKKY